MVMKLLFVFFFVFFLIHVSAQQSADSVYLPNIKTVKFYQQNNQESLPIIHLNSSDELELHFDDMDGYVKNYYYTIVLCNADWSIADVSTFDYIKGYQQQQLNQYRLSSVTLSRYVHYQAVLPDENCTPVKSGNYMLKVFLDGDTAKLAFTKKFFVLDTRVSIGASILQPFNNQLFLTYQKVQFSVVTDQLNVFNPQQQVKITLLQNYRWDNAITAIQPAFIRENVLEYNGEEDCLFPAGKEYRWADLRSFRFESERVDKVNRATQPANLYLKPDAVRTQQRYLFMQDYNGWYDISTTEFVNPWWQSDYAYVHFTFVPPGNRPFDGKELYLMGELVGNRLTGDGRMQYNATKGIYEKTLLLKQGYYSYTYVTKDVHDNVAKGDVTLTDGNYWETENNYTIFVYYRSLSDRYDELVGLTIVNSRNGR